MEHELARFMQNDIAVPDHHSYSPRSQPRQLSPTSMIPFQGPKTQQQKCPNGYLDSFPPGYRFEPYDEELVQYYLKRKIKNLPLPRNRIHNIDVYKHNPDTLAENYEAQGEKEWYFFTTRERKHLNGQRPNRSAGDGYWKATSGDKPVNFNGRKVGNRKTFVFYQGKPQNANKTSWIMQEFTVYHSPSNAQSNQNHMRLDDCALCKIYKNKQARTRNNSTAVTSERTSIHSTLIENEPTTMDTDGINEEIEQPIMSLSADSYARCAFGRDQPLQTIEVPHSLSIDEFNFNPNGGQYQPLQTTEVPLSIDDYNFNPNGGHDQPLQTSEGPYSLSVDDYEFNPNGGHDQPHQTTEVPHSLSIDEFNFNPNGGQYQPLQTTEVPLSIDDYNFNPNGGHDQPLQTSEVPYSLSVDDYEFNPNAGHDMPLQTTDVPHSLSIDEFNFNPNGGHDQPLQTTEVLHSLCIDEFNFNPNGGQYQPLQTTEVPYSLCIDDYNFNPNGGHDQPLQTIEVLSHSLSIEEFNFSPNGGRYQPLQTTEVAYSLSIDDYNLWS